MESRQPILVASEDHPEFEVEEVLQHRDRRYGRSTKRDYLVLWTGYGPHDATWEPAENLENVKEKLAAYHSRIRATPLPRRGRILYLGPAFGPDDLADRELGLRALLN